MTQEPPGRRESSPVVDVESRPFWDGLEASELRLQRCDDCGSYIYYPRVHCTHCFSSRLTWTRVSGRGTVYSFTIARRAGGADFTGRVPYVVALVDLEEGPRMLSEIETGDVDSVTIGAPCEATFARQTDGATIVKFQLAETVDGGGEGRAR